MERDDTKDRTRYVFSTLRGTAITNALSGKNLSTGVYPFDRPGDIYDALDAHYAVDASADKEECLRQLARLRQGTKDFGAFLQEFQALAAGAKLEDGMRQALLRASVNTKLATAAALAEASTFAELAMKIRRADQMMPNAAKPTFHQKKKNYEPTKGRAATTDGPRLCFNCQKPGHLARDCRGKKPGARKTQQYDSEDEDIVEHQGNE
jgi:hypothetical protein